MSPFTHPVLPSSASGLLLTFETVTKAKGITDELQDVTAEGETIQQATGQALIAQHLNPVTEGQIGRDEQRDPLM